MHLEVNPRFTAMAQAEDPRIEAVFSDASDKYIVEKHIIGDHRAFAFRLAIKRCDKESIRSWRVLQDIKNSIAGEDAVAIEIYPSEAEVTDTANMYHLWVFRAGLGPNVSLVPPVK